MKIKTYITKNLSIFYVETSDRVGQKIDFEMFLF